MIDNNIILLLIKQKCHKQRNKKQLNNKEKIAERNKQYQLDNPDYTKQWKLNNPDHNKLWQQNNKDKVSIKNKKYQLKKNNK